MTALTTTIEDQPASEPASSERATPSVAFGQAMAAVETRCDQMARRIEIRDAEGFSHTARSATNLWLAGRSACRRLLARVKDASPYHDATRSLLETRYMALLNLLALATQVMAGSELQRSLSILRQMLTTAMAQPLVDAPTDASESEAKRAAKFR